MRINTLDTMKRYLNKLKINNTNDFKKNNLDMRHMLKITRRLSENENEPIKRRNKTTLSDEREEENKIKNFFNDLNITINFDKLHVYDDLIFWGGNIDNAIEFVFTVTSDTNKGIEFKYTNDYAADNPDNQEIIKRLELYYKSFYKYWRDNIIEK